MSTKMKVMLAKEFEKGMNGSKKDKTKFSKPPIGWWMSEKFDGYRTIFYYDENDEPHFLSRTGKEFLAPEWFLHSMPSSKCLKGKMIDGELWAGRGNFQLMGTVRKKIPVDEEWCDIKFVVYDITNLDSTFITRLKELQKIVKISKEKWNTHIKKNLVSPFSNLECPISFAEQLKITSIKMMDEYYQKILNLNGEGIMLKHPENPYENGRSSSMLKYKPSFDREAIIIGHSLGTKGSKYEGILGGFICKPLNNHDTYMTIDKDPNHEFTMSGMDDKVRNSYKKTHPINTVVTFECSGFTDKGVPRFARYIRKRSDIVIKDKLENSDEKLKRIIEIFTEIEKVHKINKDHFRAKSYTKTLKGLHELNDDSELTEENFNKIDGLGKGLKEKIRCIIDTNTCLEYQKILKEKEKYELHDLFQKIHGVGPACAQKLIDLGYTSVQEIINDPQHENHLNDVQLKGLLYYNDINQRIPYEEIQEHEKYLKDVLFKIDQFAELTIAGSYRRKKKDSGDIDILLKAEDSSIYEKFIETLTNNKYIRDTLAHGPKKYMGISNIEINQYSLKNRRIDIMYTSPEEYPFAVLYFTGSKEFNVKMRNELLENGYTLNEHRVEFTDKRKKFKEVFQTEKDIFNYFNIKYVEPQHR